MNQECFSGEGGPMLGKKICLRGVGVYYRLPYNGSLQGGRAGGGGVHVSVAPPLTSNPLRSAHYLYIILFIQENFYNF